MTVIQALCEKKIETFWVTQNSAKNVEVYVCWITMAEMGEVVEDLSVELIFFFIAPQWSSFIP